MSFNTVYQKNFLRNLTSIKTSASLKCVCVCVCVGGGGGGAQWCLTRDRVVQPSPMSLC